MRHGEAMARHPFEADHERGLAPRGRDFARIVAAELARTGAAPDLVLCSSARRAVETLAAIRPSLPEAAAEDIERGLYLASNDELFDRIRAVAVDCRVVLMVAHNPGIGRLAFDLCRPESSPDLDRLSRSFPTGALVTIRFETDDWERVRPERGHLERFIVPTAAADPR